MMPSSATVFVVDDDPGARDSVAALVESIGLEGQLFESAEAFLEKYDPELSGCLVTDVRMLGMTGLELQQELVRRNVRLPVIVISAHADVQLTVRSMKAGAVTVLEKPCRDLELLDAIRAAIAQDARQRAEEAQRSVIEERLAQLTESELEVMELMIAGKANKVIASQLDMGLRTVEARRHSIFQKMSTQSVAELVQQVMLVRQDREPDQET